jgi:hypothetical protein
MPARKSYKVSKFQGGMKGAVYTCQNCGKKTRETGDGESSVGMCAKCYEEGGLENEHSDNDGEHLLGIDGTGKRIYGKHPRCPACKYEAENIGKFGCKKKKSVKKRRK